LVAAQPKGKKAEWKSSVGMKVCPGRIQCNGAAKKERQRATRQCFREVVAGKRAGAKKFFCPQKAERNAPGVCGCWRGGRIGTFSLGKKRGVGEERANLL